MREFTVYFEEEPRQIVVEYQNMTTPVWWLFIDETESRSRYVYDEYDNEEGDTVKGDFKQLLDDAQAGIFDVAAIMRILTTHEDIHPSWD